MNYTEVKENPKQAPIDMIIKTTLKNVVNSSDVVIQNYVPMVCEAVSCSFVKVANQSNTLVNEYKTETLPQLSQIEWSLNHNNNLISFPLDNQEEILLNYYHSISNSMYSDLGQVKRGLKEQGYGVGLKLPSVDLTNNQIALNIQSQVSNLDPYTLFMYFQGVARI